MTSGALSAIVAGAQRHLEGRGFSPDEARRDAGLLARWLLDWDRAAWLLRQQEVAPDGWRERFDALITRRALHEPIAYITGEREFYGRPFSVTPAVLIPRPETEFLVEEALSVMADARAAITVVDVGTGSGCLAVTIAAERPDARIVATDVSGAALDVARENARRHGVLDRIEFRHRALLAGVGAVNLIVSNPPYVAEADRPSLDAQVRDFEPAGALFAGLDGLDVIRDLLPAAARALAPGGWLLMEVGAGQTPAVRRLAEDAGLTVRKVRADLQGIPRVLVIAK